MTKIVGGKEEFYLVLDSLYSLFLVSKIFTICNLSKEFASSGNMHKIKGTYRKI